MIDVANPNHPVRVGGLAAAGVSGVQIIGQRAYLSKRASDYGTTGLLVIDVSNPAEPRLVGQYADPSQRWSRWWHIQAPQIAFLVVGVLVSVLFFFVASLLYLKTRSGPAKARRLAHPFLEALGFNLLLCLTLAALAWKLILGGEHVEIEHGVLFMCIVFLLVIGFPTGTVLAKLVRGRRRGADSVGKCT